MAGAGGIRAEGVADIALPLLAGVEKGGVACVSFQATLVVLLLLCGRLASGPGVDALRPAVAACDAIRSTRAGWLDELVALVRDRHTVYTVAPAERTGPLGYCPGC